MVIESEYPRDKYNFKKHIFSSVSSGKRNVSSSSDQLAKRISDRDPDTCTTCGQLGHNGLLVFSILLRGMHLNPLYLIYQRR